MKKFTLGAIAGMATLTLAVPLLAQISMAAEDSAPDKSNRPTPTQACVQAKATVEQDRLTNFDAMSAAHKSALQAHATALAAAGAIADDAARADALKEANDALRTAMQSTMDEESFKADMETLRTACGDGAGFHGGFGAKGPGMMMHMKHHFMRGGPGGPDTNDQ